MASEILIYTSENGEAKIDIRLEDQDIWLNQQQLAELYQTTKQNISLHLSNIFKENELTENSVVKYFLTTASDNKNYKKKYYNLDATISVGYRVKSSIATQFRIWATTRLKEFLIKGFILDDERLKEAKNDYFDELIERVRDIRTSEKLFYRKVCEIYATSVDHNSDSRATLDFFSSVHTAAELVYERANAQKKIWA